MQNIGEIIDPLMLIMKIRDSITARDPSPMQGYLREIITKMLNEAGTPSNTVNPANNTGGLAGNTDAVRQLQDTLNQSLAQLGGIPGLGDPAHLQNYIQSVFNQSISQALGQTATQPALQPAAPPALNPTPQKEVRALDKNPQMFETHNSLILRLEIPPQVNERLIDIHMGMNKVRLRWRPGENERVIQLPIDVKSDGATAVIKGGILEITLPKESNPNLKKVPIGRD